MQCNVCYGNSVYEFVCSSVGHTMDPALLQ